ncbi:MAG: hypothetical protein EBU90_07735 [Proteobacteria bacterium]|nr:hypothetical protein [Pseudomonadota bacterium]NBP14089.1 hypothetical protein [bacterium]
MALRDLTAAKHREAESTPFMKAVFARTLPFHLWVDWTYQKVIFYNAIETAAIKNLLIEDLKGILRTALLAQDFNIMNEQLNQYEIRKTTIEYHDYIKSIETDAKKVLAHLYTWHMGDMFGGQAIKRIVPGSHRSLEFENAQELMTNLRAKLDDSMGDEANIAFDWAIKCMKEYENDLA